MIAALTQGPVQKLAALSAPEVVGKGEQVFAAIDCGSSSFKLLVEKRGVDGRYAVVLDRKIGAALGKDIASDNVLPQANQDRAFEALRRFLAEAKTFGIDAADIPLIATAVVRNTTNGAAFMQQVRDELGLVQARVLQGAEEAKYGFLGALVGEPTDDPARRYATLDLGGGSFQLAVGTRTTYEKGASQQVGSNYVLEKLLGPGTLDAAKFAHADARLSIEAPMPLAPAEVQGRTLVATGGISKFLRVHFGAVTITRAEIDALRREYGALTVEARGPLLQQGKTPKQLVALGIDTAEGAKDYGAKLPASTTLLLHLMQGLGVTHVRVSSTDARHALNRESANRPHDAKPLAASR